MERSLDLGDHEPPIVSFLERDVAELMRRYPKLMRAEVIHSPGWRA